MTKALVTGGCGFIGAPLTARLVTDADVVVLDSLSVGAPENLGAAGARDAQVVVVDLERPEDVRAAIRSQRPDVVFHLAALHFIPACNADPRGAVAANVTGTQSLLDALRAEGQVARLVLASSAAVYAPAPGPHSEHDTPAPTDIYGLTKLWNEQQVRLFQSDVGCTVTIARLFNVFGPRETNEHLIPTILAQAAAGDRVSLGNLDTRRDYVYVEDVVRALVDMGTTEQRNSVEIFNVGTGVQHDGFQILREASGVLGRDISVTSDPHRTRSQDRPDLVCDCSKIADRVGWSAQTGLSEGIAQAAEEPYAPSKVL